MIKRRRLNEEATPKKSTPAPVRPLSLFGPPLLLEGEDAAAYDELVARMCAAVNPVDVLEEMFVADIVFLQWQILRYHRLQLSLISATGNKELERLLRKLLDYDLFRDEFEERLAKALQEKLSEDKASTIRKSWRGGTFRMIRRPTKRFMNFSVPTNGTPSSTLRKPRRRKSSCKPMRGGNPTRSSRSMRFSPPAA